MGQAEQHIIVNGITDTSNASNSLPWFLYEREAYGQYLSSNYLVLDFETDTSHGDFGSAIHPDNGMLLAVWRTPDGAVKASWGGEYDHADLVADCEKVLHSGGFLVAHNAKYELMWLKRMGLNLYDAFVFDTKIAEYVLLGNLAAGDERMLGRSTSLNDCCIRRGWPGKDPAVDRLMRDGINPVEMPRSWLQGRCKYDVDMTHRLFKDQLSLLVRTDRLKVLLTRCLLTPVLAAAEFNGMALDKERVNSTFEDYTIRFNELQREMDELTGGINWKSPKQAAEFLYDTLKFRELTKKDGTPKRNAPTARNPEGSRLTDQKTLDKLRPTTDEQVKFVELRKEIGKVNAAISKSLKFFQGVCKEKGGIFHAQFHQTTTATHRLSSTGVPTYFEMFGETKTAQFQNLPRQFKPLFKAKREGWLICEADGSQLEFRSAVHQARDKQGREDIISGHDVHRFTASVLNHVALDEVSKGMRQNAKADTFKPLYGGQSGTDDQQRYYKAFRARYPQITEMQQSWIDEVVISKRLITEWGLRYYWPYAKVSQYGYVNVTTSVSNYPVQAFATAEIIPIALFYFWHRVYEAGLQDYIIFVNTVHDSVICEVHPDYVEEWKEIATQAFTLDVYRYLETNYNIQFDWVPLGVGMGWGSHWSDKDNDELEMNVYYDGRREIK